MWLREFGLARLTAWAHSSRAMRITLHAFGLAVVLASSGCAHYDPWRVSPFKLGRTTAADVHVAHMSWSDADCERLARGEFWVGMTSTMLSYVRGKPDHVNISDYGSGKQYQFCWTYLTPSCFYLGEDGIVSAYN